MAMFSMFYFSKKLSGTLYYCYWQQYLLSLCYRSKNRAKDVYRYVSGILKYGWG